MSGAREWGARDCACGAGALTSAGWNGIRSRPDGYDIFTTVFRLC